MHLPRRLFLRQTESGKTAAKKISAEMAGNFLIRRGQLNRMNRRCQAGFHRQSQSGKRMS
jgi:hypothetical protein